MSLFSGFIGETDFEDDETSTYTIVSSDDVNAVGSLLVGEEHPSDSSLPVSSHVVPEEATESVPAFEPSTTATASTTSSPSAVSE